MTNKEAIEQLLTIKKFGGLIDKDRQALNFVIKALEERPQGEWIKDTTYGNTHIFCSCCKMHCAYTTNFCPHCGADMRGVRE